MKHVNGNAIKPALDGIELGEQLAASGVTDTDLQGFLARASLLHDELATRRTARFLPAREEAFLQGVIGALLAAEKVSSQNH